MLDSPRLLSKRDWDLIRLLREEAGEVKDCFTRFSFQSLLFAVAVVGLVINYQQNFQWVALATVPVSLLLLVVTRIGTYKYGSANRLFGYDLHLHRSAWLDERDGWDPAIGAIGWEEAMRAWRIVQASVFAEIYTTPYFPLCNRERTAYRKLAYRWWDPSGHGSKEARYYSESYLERMHFFLHLVAVLALFPTYYLVLQVLNDASLSLLPKVLVSSIVAAFSLVVLFSILRTNAKRLILESGLLSIHSCAIMWQAVAVAHWRAMRTLKARSASEYGGYHGYSSALVEQVESLIDSLPHIHRWMREEATPPDDDRS